MMFPPEIEFLASIQNIVEKHGKMLDLLARGVTAVYRFFSGDKAKYEDANIGDLKIICYSYEGTSLAMFTLGDFNPRTVPVGELIPYLEEVSRSGEGERLPFAGTVAKVVVGIVEDYQLRRSDDNIFIPSVNIEEKCSYFYLCHVDPRDLEVTPFLYLQAPNDVACVVNSAFVDLWLNSLALALDEYGKDFLISLLSRFNMEMSEELERLVRKRLSVLRKPV